MKNTITIQLTSLNSSVLNKAVTDLLQAVPIAEYDYSMVETLPALRLKEGKFLVSKVVFVKTTSKFAVALAKVDIPHNVNITIR